MTVSDSVEILDFGLRGQVQVVNDSAELARAAAERFASAIQDAVATRGRAAPRSIMN